MAAFIVIDEVAFISQPKLVQLVPVRVFEWLTQCLWLFIVECAIAPEPVLFPLSLVGYSLIIVVKSTTTVHTIVFPFTSIFTSLFVVECSVAMSDTIFLLALVTAFVITLHNEALTLIAAD
jgi:hypothetical protein